MPGFKLTLLVSKCVIFYKYDIAFNGPLNVASKSVQSLRGSRFSNSIRLGIDLSGSERIGITS